MHINQLKAPWIKKSRPRYNPDSFYQSKTWKDLVNFIWMRDNSLCQICKKQGIIHKLERNTKDLSKQGTVDHKIQRKKQGADEPDNLWLIGSNHHAVKSATEKNKMYK
jgi:5-methylcytosine-specific restriction endonuclease McrA